MDGKTYYLVEENSLPEVFPKVVEAKRLLADGTASSASEAARTAGISRGAFYKYRDSVFLYRSSEEKPILTVQAVLVDRPGALMAFVSVFYAAGANILTVNQNIPVKNRAMVSVSARVDAMTCSLSELLQKLKAVDGVKSLDMISDKT